MQRSNYTPVSEKYTEVKIFALVLVFIIGLPLISWLG